MRRASVTFIATVAVVAAGCVLRTEHTIEAHVTVDIRRVDATAEKIVSYVTGESDTLTTPAPTPSAEPAPQSTSWLMRALDSLSPMQTAYAAELKESSPQIKELADKMRRRHSEVQALKSQGCLGENNRGYVELFPCDGLKDTAKKNDAQRLVAAENQDRKALYRAVAELNKDQNVTLSVVERIFAEKWRSQAKAGERIQVPPKGPDFDKFKQSPVGQKLGPDVKPDEWVTLK